MIGNGLIPLALLAALLAFFLYIIRRRYATTKHEAVQSVFVLLVVAYGILALTNILFRGEGMALKAPW